MFNFDLISIFSILKFQPYQLSKLSLHNKRRSTDTRVKDICSRRYIMTSKLDMAVQIFMETDSEDSKFRCDCLK